MDALPGDFYSGFSRDVERPGAMQEETTMNPTTQNEKNSETHARIDHAAERTKQGVSEAVGGAKDKVDKAADRIEEGLHHAANVGAQGSHRVADKAGEWHDRSAELASEARDRAGQAIENLRERVHEKPVQSIAIALALGWLVGRLLRPHD
ncbi:MAG TPA: hypothetical protein VJL61_00935 [Rhodanobacteraceae bacterium]|nr:hypothetical protein [Rhodanobacteraceae bacterium]